MRAPLKSISFSNWAHAVQLLMSLWRGRMSVSGAIVSALSHSQPTKKNHDDALLA